MTERFAPWRPDFIRGTLLLAAAAGIVAAAGAWLAARGWSWQWPPALSTLLPLVAAVTAMGLGSSGLRRLRRGRVRREGKRIERDAIGALGALPWGWQAQANVRLPGGGDVDLMVRTPWGRRYAVEIKSKGAVTVERRLFGLIRRLRDAQGRPLAHDPLAQTVRNARSLDARPVLWLPRGDGPVERLGGGVMLVRGDAERLRQALGAGGWAGCGAALAAGLAAAMLAAVLLLVLMPAAQAQAFRPYAQFRITAEQWQTYRDAVHERFGATAQPLVAERLVVYEDRAARMLWAFTEPGHAAHPAWVAKRVVRIDQAVGIQQVGYFAGDEVAFGRLFRSYDRAPAD